MKKSTAVLMYLIAIAIGLIPAIVALIQKANTYTLAKYYLITIIIVIILWSFINRLIRKKDAI